MGVVSPTDATTVRRDPRQPWVPTPFTRLARTHAFSVAGDTLFTAAMAGTVFFSVTDFDAAKGRVALLLMFTIAPFAVAAPLLGPLLDRARGGRRWMIVGLAVARAVLCILIIRHRDSWLFYGEALLFLVLSKGYLIARGAVVPTTVHDDAELVKANSRLALLSGVTAAMAAVPAVLLLWLGGASWVLALGAAMFVGCAVVAVQLPATRVAPEPADAVERAELRSVGILVAASSMGAVRLIVGFLVFQIGFYAKDNDQGLLIVAAAIAAQIGFLGGSLGSPVLRRSFTEERILAIVLAFTVAAGLLAALLGLAAGGSAITLGLAATLLSVAVGATSNVGKQAFDAIVQRDAPDANRGRSFARFETRFQLVWVLGALIPTFVDLPLEASYVFVSAVAAFALLSYLVGRRRAAAGVDHRLVRFPAPMARWPGTRVAAVRSRLGFARNGDDTAPVGVPAPPGAVGSSPPAQRPAPAWPLAQPPSVPGEPMVPAVTGRLGLGDPGDPGAGDPTISDPAGGLFDGGEDPTVRYTLDPRRVLDPTVPIEQSGVGSPRYLGFLGDVTADAAADTQVASGGDKSGPRRRRRRRSKQRHGEPLPGFDTSED
jgi:hypothetical protein